MSPDPIRTTSSGRLCVAKSGYVALRPQTPRARRRASAGVSPLSLRSGLPAPRRSGALLPKSLTVQTVCCAVVVLVVPRKQHVSPAIAGFFFAALSVRPNALSSRACSATRRSPRGVVPRPVCLPKPRSLIPRPSPRLCACHRGGQGARGRVVAARLPAPTPCLIP